MKIYLATICILFSLSLFAKTKGHIYTGHSAVPKSEREAMLILPGFASKLHGTKRIAEFFSGKGYDIYIPKYISRKSINGSVENLDRFITRHKLKEYKKLHVYAYIIGSWTINDWINKNPDNNISTIIYDRSPFQERAPYALVHDMPFLIRLAYGKIMKEFSETDYPPILAPKIYKGIIIESKATNIFIKHKKSAMAPGPINWNFADLHQPCNDEFYALLNHDEMYSRFDIAGNEVFYFIANHKFADTLRRKPFDVNLSLTD